MQFNLVPVEYSAERVLTTEQLAQVYECATDNIKKNFNANKEKFVEGKHYFKLEGIKLNELRVTFSDLQISSMTRSLYLWTKRGALRHCKMLGTDNAWEMFDLLEESYFDDKETRQEIPVNNNITLDDAVRAIGETSLQLQKYFGVAVGISLAKSIELAEENFQFKFGALKSILPPAEHEIGSLTPTLIGKKLGISARQVNQLLVDAGLQVREGLTYRLTDEGKRYGEAMPFTNNGHSGYQIKWITDVLTVLRNEVMYDECQY